jgi:hypothetical protein
MRRDAHIFMLMQRKCQANYSARTPAAKLLLKDLLMFVGQRLGLRWQSHDRITQSGPLFADSCTQLPDLI